MEGKEEKRGLNDEGGRRKAEERWNSVKDEVG